MAIFCMYKVVFYRYISATPMDRYGVGMDQYGIGMNPQPGNGTSNGILFVSVLVWIGIGMDRYWYGSVLVLIGIDMYRY